MDIVETLSQLDELRSQATPGDWCVHPNGTSVWNGREYDCDDRSQWMIFRTGVLSDESVSNAEFVVELVNAYPLLVASLRAKSAEIERLMTERPGEKIAG